MTNSMIPYSFVPGTKAKAGEVNANFIALAEVISQNNNSALDAIATINSTLLTKADKTQLINEHIVTEIDTDLDDYTTKGTYRFSSSYTPSHVPTGSTAGILIVTNDGADIVKQIWFCNETYNNILTRDFDGTNWSDWSSIAGDMTLNSPVGYVRCRNGLLIQWGMNTNFKVTYPIAYTSFCSAVVTKSGKNNSSQADSGFSTSGLVGFTFVTGGYTAYLNWIAIGI